MADVCYCFGEGAPLDVNDMKLDIPPGFDFDFCAADTVLQATVRDGRIVLPSGTSYRYLKLPDADRMTLPLARKVRELVNNGARIIGDKRFTHAPGLTDFPECDTELKKIAAELWDGNHVICGKTLGEVFVQDELQPDFEGEALHYIHRRIDATDIYFVSHQENRPATVTCTFRVAGKRPELWDPETGAIRVLPEFSERDSRIRVPLQFEPMQSWFVVFRERESTAEVAKETEREKNFPELRMIQDVSGPWQVSFDPRWGGPDTAMDFAELTDWSKHADPRIHYYSGTAIYRVSFDMPASVVQPSRVLLDLGSVEVMAQRETQRDRLRCGLETVLSHRHFRCSAYREKRPGNLRRQSVGQSPDRRRTASARR